ncbi:alpha-L-glutamate ligase, RimK family [Methanococcus vannielii SB]|jgi:tetrahydromethanopterin:alpha-L-glutamate ligase|uniref:Alpha-L-glutamate ligase, RimK family n=1 Tax=Methanococcus vannielii (strain ATCC 35089 / DSM 1224 / JCM 13029 / OCM 148 / SB) TaxID=406327 RepID=A6USK0_METVS|nr:tetrahydromethanopterin:alpha-L-glutamate ligase [Methanococcus vannielii]ABR55472.1 alpha-L-glutamate ligase, RimK family [Methanococcus vannielii SB]
MKMGIISEERDWVTDELKSKMEKNDIDPVFIQPSKIVSSIASDVKFEHNNRNITDLECAFIRNIGDGVEMFHRFDTLKYLENYVPIINPMDGIENAGNKFRTSFLMEVNKIPHPKTIISEDVNKALIAAEKFEDVVLKPLFGSQGRGLVRVKGRSTVAKLKALNTFKSNNGVIYLQEFVTNPNNVYRDIRAFAVGDKVVSAMYRKSDSWITNIHQNGVAEKCEVSEELSKLVLAAKDALGLVYAGVDVMESSDGLKVIEVNACPSWEGLSRVSDTNITQYIIDAAIEYSKRC